MEAKIIPIQPASLSMHGICTEEALWSTAVEDVWGIGRQHAQRLRRQGVNTVLDLSRLPDAWVKKHMAVTGLRTVRELRGEPCIDLELVVPPRQNICTSRLEDLIRAR